VLLVAVIAIGVAAWVGPAQPSASRAQAVPSIRILGAVGSNGVIVLQVRITHWKMYPKLLGKAPRPDGGHWHIYVNGRYNNYSVNPTRGSTKLNKLLPPGTYRVSAHLANNNFTEPRPRIVSNIVTVRLRPQTSTNE
jgi:hypothetical protein